MCQQWHYFFHWVTVHHCPLNSLCIEGCIHFCESPLASFLVGRYFHVVEEKASDMLLLLMEILLLLNHSSISGLFRRGCLVASQGLSLLPLPILPPPSVDFGPCHVEWCNSVVMSLQQILTEFVVCLLPHLVCPGLLFPFAVEGLSL